MSHLRLFLEEVPSWDVLISELRQKNRQIFFCIKCSCFSFSAPALSCQAKYYFNCNFPSSALMQVADNRILKVPDVWREIRELRGN